MNSEKQEALQTNHLQSNSARRESSDSGVESDIENDYGYSTDDTESLIPKSESKNPEVINKTSNDISTALKVIKKDKQKFEKWQKKGSVDISSIEDGEKNNILHRIALLKKKQKCRSLDSLAEKIPKEKLTQLIDGKNKEEKTPLQEALINKITKGKHWSHTTQSNDNTLKFVVALLKHGANLDQLKLPEKFLHNLQEEQKTYYSNFLKKLEKSLAKSKVEPEIRINTKAKIEEVTAHTINTTDSNGNYLLHSAITIYNKKSFEELLQKGADTSLKDASGDNALHLIVKKLKKKQRLEFLTILRQEGQKEQFAKAINDKNNNNQTPLHQLLQHIQEKSKKPSLKDIIKKEFKEKNRYKVLKLLLENGTDINAQDGKGKNALHHIALLKGEQKVACLKLILDLVEERKISQDKLREAVNSKNQEGRTPLHQLLQHIKGKNEDRSCTDRKFEKTKRYKALELLLQNGADITAQDKEGKNALHHIALLKGEQKVACLDLILDLVRTGNISEDKLSKAVNTKNDKKQTPLQVALIAKIMKNKHNFFNPKSRDNRVKFCVKLLQNGADPKQSILPESLWNTEYYQTIKGIEESIKLPISDDMRTKLKLNFGKKFKARDIVRYVNSVVCKVVTTLVFVAVTCAVVFSAAQGSITLATASSIIAAIGVCYLIYLNLENIYEGFKKLKGKFTEEKQPTHTSKNDTQHNDSSQSMENKPNSLEEQKTQDQSENTKSSPSAENAENWKIQKSSDQSECTEKPPSSGLNNVSVANFIENFVANSVINKPFSPGR